MCGRITLSTDKDDLQSRWGFIDPSGVLDLIKPRYNIAPSQNSPTLVVKEDRRVLAMMRWGLVPFWAKEASIGYKMINAKSETLTEKPSFRKPFKEKRCLVLADGFYEWEKTDKKNKVALPFCTQKSPTVCLCGSMGCMENSRGRHIAIVYYYNYKG